MRLFRWQNKNNANWKVKQICQCDTFEFQSKMDHFHIFSMLFITFMHIINGLIKISKHVTFGGTNYVKCMHDVVIKLSHLKWVRWSNPKLENQLQLRHIIFKCNRAKCHKAEMRANMTMEKSSRRRLRRHRLNCKWVCGRL